eukprot:c9269_g1_i2.p1 GENE.c9269_g1_i2~~c9269_g1_i2.p1  ORF type:complete len:145 (-),score=25.77 c9269_g1_i2:734-1168(-)
MASRANLLWNLMLDRFDLFTITTIISALIHLFITVVTMSTMVAVELIPAFHKYKIQKDKAATARQQMVTLGYVLLTQLVIQFPLILGNFKFIQIMKIPFSYETIPPWWDMLWRLYLCLVLEDTWHYFAHRLLHHKSIYRYIHKV